MRRLRDASSVGRLDRDGERDHAVLDGRQSREHGAEVDRPTGESGEPRVRETSQSRLRHGKSGDAEEQSQQRGDHSGPRRAGRPHERRPDHADQRQRGHGCRQHGRPQWHAPGQRQAETATIGRQDEVGRRQPAQHDHSDRDAVFHGGELGVADAADVLDVVDALEGAVGGAVVDDLLRRGRADALQRVELFERRRVDVDRRRGGARRGRAACRPCSPPRRRPSPARRRAPAPRSAVRRPPWPRD